MGQATAGQKGALPNQAGEKPIQLQPEQTEVGGGGGRGGGEL